MNQYTIQRTGQPPLRFTGEEIGHGTTRRGTNDGGRWKAVTIYRTKAGKYVAALKHVTQWEGEHDHYSAAAKETPNEIIAWLQNGEPTLGRASEEAVELAVENDPGFAAVWVEPVE